MSYPTILDIKTSIESRVLIKDTFVQTGTFERQPNNVLKMFVGGFSVVFPFTKNDEKWAFRCWHANLGNLKGRYKKIAQAINNSNLPYFAKFDYEDIGIVVNGSSYPTTRMKWIDGNNIKNYLCENRYNKQKLELLAKNFKQMCKDMHRQNLAHGDLQHGNILVTGNSDLFLVDYDSMYCPELEGEVDIIFGLVDYQHPKRKMNKFTNKKNDYFSELIIYLSILITIEFPELIDKYEVEHSERMFFNKDDFANLRDSAIISDLASCNDEIQLLIEILTIYLSKNDIVEIESFDVLLELLSLFPVIINFGNLNGSDVFAGDNIHLFWNVQNVNSIYINDFKIGNNIQFYNEIIYETKKYTIKLINGIKTVTQDIEIKTSLRPQIKFEKKINKLKHGQSGFLNWSIQNAKSSFLSHGIGNVELNGEIEILPDETTTYKIEVLALDNKTTFEKYVTVEVFEEGKILFFNADRQFVLQTMSVVLSWETENAIKVEIEGIGEVELVGSVKVVPFSDTKYKLIVTDQFGTIEKYIQIKILPLPLIEKVIVQTPNIVNENIIRINLPNFSSISSNYPNTVEFRQFDFCIKLDSKTFIPTPKHVKLKYEVNRVSIIEKVQRIFKYIKNEFVTSKK
jgi:serine/threonine protein kinase